jgi:hypothetical protein
MDTFCGSDRALGTSTSRRFQIGGRFLTLGPTVFPKEPEMLPEVEDLWITCPDCRQQQTARQWIDMSKAYA